MKVKNPYEHVYWSKFSITVKTCVSARRKPSILWNKSLAPQSKNFNYCVNTKSLGHYWINHLVVLPQSEVVIIFTSVDDDSSNSDEAYYVHARLSVNLHNNARRIVGPRRNWLIGLATKQDVHICDAMHRTFSHILETQTLCCFKRFYDLSAYMTCTTHACIICKSMKYITQRKNSLKHNIVNIHVNSKWNVKEICIRKNNKLVYWVKRLRKAKKK